MSLTGEKDHKKKNTLVLFLFGILFVLGLLLTGLGLYQSIKSCRAKRKEDSLPQFAGETSNFPKKHLNSTDSHQLPMNQTIEPQDSPSKQNESSLIQLLLQLKKKKNATFSPPLKAKKPKGTLGIDILSEKKKSVPSLKSNAEQSGNFPSSPGSNPSSGKNKESQDLHIELPHDSFEESEIETEMFKVPSGANGSSQHD